MAENAGGHRAMSSVRSQDGWSKDQNGAELTACGETIAVVRKKALLRVLARHAADRAGIQVKEADLKETSDWFRRNFGLIADEEFSSWIERQGLTELAFAKAMQDFTIVRLVEEAFAEEIDQLVPDQIAISTARLLSDV
jgi:hypothetical protein